MSGASRWLGGWLVHVGGWVQVSLRSWDSEWSSTVVDVPSAHTLGGGHGQQQQQGGAKVYNYVSLRQRGVQRDRKCQYDLGLMIKAAAPPFHRTTLVTFVARYVLVSKLDTPLEYSQAG